MLLHQKRLIKNIVSLYIIQAMNYAAPFLLYGYLTRTLGPENFGLFMYVQGLLLFVIFITDYGFNTSALRVISADSLAGADSKIVSRIIMLKLMLAVVIYSLILSVAPVLKAQILSLLLSGGIMVIGNILSPVWLYHAKQQLQYLTIVNLVSKLIPLGAILFLVHQHNQVVLVQMIISIGWLLGGVTSFFIARKLFKLTWVFPSSADLILELKQGAQIFLANSFASIYSYGAVIILGWFSSYAIVGAYCIAERVSRAIISLVQPFTQAIFPVLIASLKRQEYPHRIIKKSLHLTLVSGIIIGFILCILAPWITKLITGKVDSVSIIAMRYWGIATFFIIQSVLLGPVLYALNLDKYLTKAYFVCSFTFAVVDLILTKYYGYQGTCWAIILSEGGIYLYFLSAWRRYIKCG